VNAKRLKQLPTQLGRRLFSVAAAVMLWWILSLVVGSMVVPSPWAVFNAFGEILVQEETVFHVGRTLGRILAGFLLAEAIGIILGTLMGLRRFFESILDLWMIIALTIPGLSWALVSLMLFGLSEIALIMAIAVTSFPYITVNIWAGVKNVDTKVVEMAKVFHVSKMDALAKVIFPQIVPYIFSSSRYGVGIAWKVAVVVELMGATSGVGYMLNYWYGLFSMKHVLAWTIFLLVIMTVIEFAVIRVLESRTLRWKPQLTF
jgi:NitT/TauT family transport system permease protein